MSLSQIEFGWHCSEIGRRCADGRLLKLFSGLGVDLFRSLSFPENYIRADSRGEVEL
jgi:hypothetical protein